MQEEKAHTINSHLNQDKVFKESMELFIGSTLDFLEVETTDTIMELLDSEMTETTTKKSYTDKSFRTVSNKGIHLEWEVEISIKDMARFAAYNADQFRKHGITFETVIITVKEPIVTAFKSPSMTFAPKIVVLKSRDADNTIKRIENSIAKGETINPLELVYLPLYGSKEKSMLELTQLAVELIPKAVPDNKMQTKMNSLLTLLMGTFVSEEEFRIILEVIAMTAEKNVAIKVLSEIYMEKGMEQGKEIGKEIGMEQGKELKAKEIAYEMLKEGFATEVIARCVRMPITWVESIAK